jgi:integrase
MSRDPSLPPRVYAKGRWYWLVAAQGKKRVWTKLTTVRDGLPALYRKLADLAARDIAPDRMPALVVDWTKEVSAHRSKKTQANDTWVTNAISKAFAEFRASEITSPDCSEFLSAFKTRPLNDGTTRPSPRTFNEMRAGLRELMRFAEEKGYRPAGSNPVDSIKTMPTPARDRYPTDSELRRIKVAAHYGKDGKRTRMGPTIALLIDLAYLTGQRVSDLLDLRWSRKAALDAQGLVEAPYVDDDGIYFKPSKTAGSTGAKVLIQWTPRLEEAIERAGKLGRRNLRWVITSQEAQRYDYEAFKSAWSRAIERSSVKGLHFNDLRAKALTDKEEREGMQQARRMGAHSTESQTADYVRHRKAERTDATR